MGQDASAYGDSEIDAMAKVWIEEHWGLQWPEGIDAVALGQVRALMARLRQALESARGTAEAA